MEHSAYKEMLSALLDGELHGAEREAALAHMDGCADCRAYFSDLTALRAALGDLEEFDAPGDFAAGVMARIRPGDAIARPHAGDAPKARRKRASWRGCAALAACAAVVLLAVYALPNVLFMGGNSAAADRAIQSAPAAAPDAPAESQSDPETAPEAPVSDCGYTYAGGGIGGDPSDMPRESVKAGSLEMAAPMDNRVTNGTSGGEAERGEADGERYCVTAQTDEKMSIISGGEAPVTSLAGAPEADGAELPVLTLSGEGAAVWLAENGWRGESGAWYADAAALRALPDGLAVSRGSVPEDYDGAVLVELGEAEP